MRTLESVHHFSCRCKDPALAQWPYYNEDRCQLPVDFKSLLDRINQTVGDNSLEDSAREFSKGKKRVAPSVSAGDTKRTKVDDSDVEVVENATVVPVYRHTYDLRYTRRQINNSNSNSVTGSRTIILDDKALKQAEETEGALLAVLRGHCAGSPEDTTIDLGDFSIPCFPFYPFERERPVRVCPLGSDRHICILPRDADRIDVVSYDVAPRHNDIYSCLSELPSRPFPRASVFTHVKLIVKPTDAWDASTDDLPFRLIVDMTMSFHAPLIFEPLTDSRLAEEARRALLHFAFPPPSLGPPFHNRIDIPFFYASIKPAPQLSSTKLYEAAQPDALLPTLLPFQRRTVAWMLEREDKTLDASSGAVVDRAVDLTDLPLFWESIRVKPESGTTTTWYFRRLTSELTSEFPSQEMTCFGASVCEEPGLGKTLECIALILLNPGIGRNPTVVRWDPEAKVEVKQIKTNLIVTPVSLSQQWKDEITLHSPTLKVFVYEGWNKLPVPITHNTAVSIGKPKLKRKGNVGRRKNTVGANGDAMEIDEDSKAKITDNMDWAAFVNTFDVVITTYNVLQQDLNVARAPPVRPRREVAEYSRTERARSPLIMVEWFRVIMDEVQMVGGGKTEQMVSLIPRLSSFAVSGTPARSHVADLSHVLKFLRVDPMIYSQRIWSRLLRAPYASDFAALFQKYTVRTMKSAVKDELTIPQQTRYLVPIELGRVERHVYDQNIENALLDLGLDARGVAASEDWELDSSVLRTWLRKLRQICTHPQVGSLSSKEKQLGKSGALKTMAEVLEGMRDQNWKNMMEDRRTKVNELATAAQLVQHDKGAPATAQRAANLLLQAEQEANAAIQDVQAEIGLHDEKGEVLKKEAAAVRAARGKSAEPDPFDKGKGKARVVDDSSSDESDDDSDSMSGEGMPKTPAGREHMHKKTGLVNRLRDWYLTLHRVKFLQGDVYHVMGDHKALDEEAAYAAAEVLRKQLLKLTEVSAVRAMGQLKVDVTTSSSRQGVNLEKILVAFDDWPKGGIRSSDLMDQAKEIVDELLNAQARLLWKWREHIYHLIAQPLGAPDSEADGADGQEYSRSLATQGEAEVYLQSYASLLADRREVLVNERTMLAVHDAKEKKLRRTKAAAKAVAHDDDADMIDTEVEVEPEHMVLRKQLEDERRALLAQFEGVAVKSIVVQLNAVVAKLPKEDDPEKILAREGASALRKLMSDQASANEKLEADLALFRKAFNERILYFRQLQEISDSVVEVQWDGAVGDAVKENETMRVELEKKINTARARHRYLNHLANKEGEGGQDDEEDACILCKCEFVRGYITQCAHVYCEDCMKSWLTKQHGKACPVCRVPLDVSSLQRFSIQDKSKDAPVSSLPVKLSKDGVPRSLRTIEYNYIRASLFEDIAATESEGSYGSKIQTLVRHLLLLQQSEPGAKSIVFSAWADSLSIIEHALNMNGIPCLRIDSTKGKQNAAKRFRTDPDLLVLLLHGERENAGLNVTCASRVFLLESVVQHSFEIQAIARIDRLGQTRPTEVYCYYAEDTVEKNILDLAAREGLSLYTKDSAQGTLNVTPLAPDSEKNVVDSPSKGKGKGRKAAGTQKGDFIIKTDDMLAILFPHLYEDLEFLLPPEAGGANAGGSHPGGGSPQRTASMRSHQQNAVAGPSRTH